MSQPMPSYTDDLSMRIYADLQKTHQDVLKTGYDRTAEIIAANERYGLAEEARNQRNTQYILDAIKSTSSDGLAATERTGSANLSATQKVGADLGMQAERLANENMLQFGNIRDRVTDYFYQTSKDFCHVNDTIRENKYDLSRQAGDYFAKSQVDLIKVENSLGRQADHNFANVQKQVCDLGARLELQAANNTAAIQIEALKTKGDILQKMADCCCEIKEKVITTSDSVKELVKDQDASRLRDALYFAEARNIFNHHGRHHDRHDRFDRPYGGFGYPGFPPYPFPFPFPCSPPSPGQGQGN